MGDYNDEMMRNRDAAVQARTKAQNRASILQLKLAQKRAKIHKIRLENGAIKAAEELQKYDPSNDPNVSRDPYKTLFVAKLNYETMEHKIKREFEAYGAIKRVHLVTDKATNEPRGYAFVEYMHTRHMKTDGQKLDKKRVLVDVEQGRTLPNWRPRRLGGGLGSTQIGGEDLNQKYSGRKPQQIASVHAHSEEPRSREDRHAEREKSRERGRDRDREHEKSRERSHDKMHDSDPREDRHHRDHDRSRDREMARGQGRDHGWNRAGIVMWTMVMITTGNVDGITIVKGIGTTIVMTMSMSGVVPVIGTIMLSQNRNKIGLATGRGSMMTLSPNMMENDMGTLSLKTNLKVMIIMSVIAMDNWIPMMNKSGMKEWSPMTIRTDLIVMTQRHKKGRRVEIGNESISHSDLKVLLESRVF